MKYNYKYPVSQYTRPSTYTPTNYTSTSYATKSYSPSSYCPSSYSPSSYSPSSYSPSSYSSTKFTPTHYTPTLFTPPAYTPAYRGASSYSYASVYSKPTRQVSSPAKPAQQAPTPAIKPAKAVRFTNDVIFQDYIRHGELEMIGRFMRARKVRLSTIFPSGMAALHEAVLSGNLECVKLLIKYGADVHQRDEDDWTPLHMACSDGYPEIAQYLLSLGASTDAENANGEKPADLIDPDCKELLKLFEVGCV